MRMCQQLVLPAAILDALELEMSRLMAKAKTPSFCITVAGIDLVTPGTRRRRKQSEAAQLLSVRSLCLESGPARMASKTFRQKTLN